MSNLNGDILSEELVGTEASWNNEDSKIGKDIVVITSDTDVIKQGDATKLFSELDSIYSPDKLATARVNVSIINPDILTLAQDRIAKVGVTTLEQTAYHNAIFDLIFEDGKFYSTCSISPVKVTSPGQQRYGTILKLIGDSFSSYLSKGVKISKYEWTLPNDTTVETTVDNLEYNIPDDDSLVGTSLVFKVRAFDELDNRSAYTTISILISDNSDPIITNTTFEKII
jgi:hypothetical protein